MLSIERDFAALLRRAMGLDAGSIGTSAVGSAVRARMGALGLEDLRTYWERINQSPGELQALIESIVVPETWFFRDREAFAALARFATEWFATHPEDSLRVLSVPCSTGEEPWSIAMTLAEAGLPIARCCVDAVDISAPALAHAQRGVYRNNSFRGADLTFRERHFEPTAEGWRLRDEVRTPVNLRQGNLLADHFDPGEAAYDMIFCRNLLIYFDRDTQARAITVLQRLLKADGVLFVGSGEGVLPLNHGFASARVPLAFAFRREEPAPVAAPPPPKAPAPLPSPPVSSIRTAPAPLPARAEPAPPSCEQLLEQASLLADRGELVEASHCCEDTLRRYGPTAQAYYLMGLIAEAGGQKVRAAQYYRKVLYLDQQHQETLAHLALLLESDGDFAAAQVLRERLHRLTQQSCAS